MAIALEGSEGWLFLDQDGYRSVAQYTGQVRLSQGDLEGWRTFFERMGTLAGRGIQHLFMVAPSKEKVVPHLYPHARSPHTPVDDIARELAPPELYYPLEILSDPAAALPTYPKTDSHWTDYGAMLVAADLMTRFGRPVHVRQPADFVLRNALLDLGGKLDPPRREEVSVDDIVPARLRTSDNRLPNTGRIMVSDNPDADPGTCLVFGDSFSIRLCKWLRWSFRRVVFVFGTDVDWSIIEAERPLCVLTQKGERGIVNPFGSAPAFSTKALIRRRIEAPDNPLREAQIAAFPTYWGHPFEG